MQTMREIPQRKIREVPSSVASAPGALLFIFRVLDAAAGVAHTAVRLGAPQLTQWIAAMGALLVGTTPSLFWLAAALCWFYVCCQRPIPHGCDLGAYMRRRSLLQLAKYTCLVV